MPFPCPIPTYMTLTDYFMPISAITLVAWVITKLFCAITISEMYACLARLKYPAHFSVNFMIFCFSHNYATVHPLLVAIAISSGVSFNLFVCPSVILCVPVNSGKTVRIATSDCVIQFPLPLRVQVREQVLYIFCVLSRPVLPSPIR